MTILPRIGLTAGLVVSLCLGAQADPGFTPGSILVYPIVKVGGGAVTVLNITNTNLLPLSTTNVKFIYVDAADPNAVATYERTDSLGAAGTRTFLADCHSPSGPMSGYLAALAQDPLDIDTDWSYNHLLGSLWVANGSGAVYSVPAISVAAVQASEVPTDLDQDGRADFDGVEYAGLPDVIYLDSFLAGVGERLTLIELGGGTKFVTEATVDSWNDSGFMLSGTIFFTAWTEVPLENISLGFDPTFLANSTPNDPSEFDFNCDNDDDLEAGWARIVASSSSSVQTVANTPLLGAVVGNGIGLERGRPLWDSPETQLNGTFLNTAVTANL